MNKTILLSILALLLNFNIGAQTINNTYFQIDTIKYKDCEFPILSNNYTPKVSEKINKILQIDRLDLLVGYQKKNIFETYLTENDSDFYSRYSLDISQIEENNNKLISLEFLESTCGATCYYIKHFYNFDSKTGNKIKLSNLFSSTGFVAFKTLYKNIAYKQLEKNLLSVPKKERAYLRKEILQVINDNSYFSDFLINKDTLYVEKWNYLHKTIKFMSEEGNWCTGVHFPISNIKNYLNDYGKYIFNLPFDSTKIKINISDLTLFEGTIANEKVTLLLDQSDKSRISSKYLYNKYGICLNLYGKQIGDDLFLEEVNQEGEKSGDIFARISSNQIIGYWYSVNRGKKYKVLLERK